MTGKSTLAAGLAVLASLALHGMLLSQFAPDAGGTETPLGTAEVSMLGQSFEDLAAGSVAPSVPDAVSRTAAQPITSRDTTRTPPTTSTPATPALSASPRMTSSVTPVETAPVTATTAARPTVPATATRPERASTLRPTPDRITAPDAPEAQRPTGATPRPQTRPPRPAPQPATAPPPQEGNADRNAVTGTDTGQTNGTTPQRQGNPDAAPGPTAREIARYPQQVNRHLSRLRRPNTRFDGAALVGFRIAASGGLASITILRSSGDAGFDDLALRHIRGAVPFPAPPEGAQTQFSVTVRGR